MSEKYSKVTEVITRLKEEGMLDKIITDPDGALDDMDDAIDGIEQRVDKIDSLKGKINNGNN